MQAYKAVVILQAGWRARMARLQLRLLKAAVVIQKHARGASARAKLAHRHAAAIQIQVSQRF